MSSRVFSQLRRADGISLIEVIVVAGVISVVMGITVGPLMGIVRDSRADSSMSTVLDTLRLARDRAIGERRNFAVRFIEPNRIQIARQDLPSGETITADTRLDGNMEFLTVGDNGDTPDEFGDGSDEGIQFGVSPTRSFTSEGTFVNSDGDPLNGTLFLAIKGADATSARAVTILGATALIHTYRWNGKEWVD